MVHVCFPTDLTRIPSVTAAAVCIPEQSQAALHERITTRDGWPESARQNPILSITIRGARGVMPRAGPAHSAGIPVPATKTRKSTDPRNPAGSPSPRDQQCALGRTLAVETAGRPASLTKTRYGAYAQARCVEPPADGLPIVSRHRGWGPSDVADFGLKFSTGTLRTPTEAAAAPRPLHRPFPNTVGPRAWPDNRAVSCRSTSPLRRTCQVRCGQGSGGGVSC